MSCGNNGAGDPWSAPAGPQLARDGGERAPHGGITGAFFDMDYTLLDGSSGRLYLKYLREEGLIRSSDWLRILLWSGLYMAGAVSFPRLMAKVTAFAAGSSDVEAWRLADDWNSRMLRHHITPAARERVDWHRARGHHVAIVSGSTQYAVSMVARELDISDRYLCTRLEIVDGHFTGRIIQPPCFRDGKLILAREYADIHGIDLSLSYFYSDSHHDRALLEAVGHPVAVNADRRLVQLAHARNWNTMRFY